MPNTAQSPTFVSKMRPAPIAQEGELERLPAAVGTAGDAERLWVSADAFEEFFAETSADEARRQLGPAEQSAFLTRRRPESSSPGWSAYYT